MLAGRWWWRDARSVETIALSDSEGAEHAFVRQALRARRKRKPVIQDHGAATEMCPTMLG